MNTRIIRLIRIHLYIGIVFSRISYIVRRYINSTSPLNRREFFLGGQK